MKLRSAIKPQLHCIYDIQTEKLISIIIYALIVYWRVVLSNLKSPSTDNGENEDLQEPYGTAGEHHERGEVALHTWNCTVFASVSYTMPMYWGIQMSWYCKVVDF